MSICFIFSIICLLCSLSNDFANADCKSKLPPKPIPPRDWTYFVDVIPMVGTTFQYDLNSYDYAMVLYTKYWDDGCKAIWDEYLLAAYYTVLNDPVMYLLVLECDHNTDNTKTCDEYNIVEVPTYKVYFQGKWIKDYKGTRKSDDIVNFMKNFACENPLPPSPYY